MSRSGSEWAIEHAFLKDASDLDSATPVRESLALRFRGWRLDVSGGVGRKLVSAAACSAVVHERDSSL